MTTHIRLPLSIEPGARTCVGCDLIGTDTDDMTVCEAFRRTLEHDVKRNGWRRLPECLEAERKMDAAEWQRG